MILLKKKKKTKRFKVQLIKYLETYWKQNYNPSIKELKNDLEIRNTQLLKKTLRRMRIEKYLDGSYDNYGVYRIYPFNSLPSESVLYSHPYAI